jgi:hypothetical protein
MLLHPTIADLKSGHMCDSCLSDAHVLTGVTIRHAQSLKVEKLKYRWVVTGMWQKLMEIKEVVIEPRAGDKSDFETVMKTFYGAVEGCKRPGAPGALFFAVARGKVSEGLDFSDNNARAVISLGIPFPSLGDPQVVEKRRFNDQRSKVMNVLTGNRWYESQAFRALNQGLGRCTFSPILYPAVATNPVKLGCRRLRQRAVTCVSDRRTCAQGWN